jgi:uncharacterized protein YyaL (SSP411 family)
MQDLDEGFADRTRGGYFRTREGREPLFVRDKPYDDGALPSGNSVALMNHLRLAEITAGDAWRRRGAEMAEAFAGALAARPLALAEMLLAVDFQTDEVVEIAVVLPESAKRDEAEPLLSVLRRAFVPNRVLVIATQNDLAGDLGKLVPWAASKPVKNGRPTAYVCRKGACDLPAVDPGVFARQLGRGRPQR